MDNVAKAHVLVVGGVKEDGMNTKVEEELQSNATKDTIYI